MADKKKVFENREMTIFVTIYGVVEIESKRARAITVHASVEKDGAIEIASSTPMVITEEGGVRTTIGRKNRKKRS